MHRIVYVSTGQDITDTDLADILEVAQRRNAQEGITGFVMFNGRNFIQLVEGEEAALRSLMAALLRDPRHTGVVTLVDEPIAARCCAEWTMNRISLLDSANQRRSDIDDALPADLDGLARRVALNFSALN